MRSTLLLVVMLAACAPEMPTVAETSGGEVEGAAGSVGVQAEALTADPCSLSTIQAAKQSMKNGWSCDLNNWNPSNSFYTTYNMKRTSNNCTYAGNAVSVKIDNPVNNNFISCDFRISKTTGSDPRFNPWLRATCLPNHSTCTTTYWN